MMYRFTQIVFFQLICINELYLSRFAYQIYLQM